MKSTVLMVIGSILLVAVSFSFLRPTATERRVPYTSLSSLLPAKAAGWTITDEALAPTEGKIDLVRKKLDFDDYVYRRFQLGTHSFDVYAAYWAPAKIPTSMVAAHTPDVCWVSAGWEKFAGRSDVHVALLHGENLSAEWRIFTNASGQMRYVWFWHVGTRGIDNNFLQYGTSFQYVGKRLKSIWAEMNSEISSQYFIRVTSDRPFEKWQAEEIFCAVMETLGKLTLKDGTR